jgi:outer membrane protein insertion porin family
VSFHQRKQDSLYVRQSYGIDVRGEAAEDMVVGASFERMSTTPQEGYGARVLSGSEQTLVGLSFSYDMRDDAVTPRSGSLYSTEYRTGRKRIGGPGGSSGHTTQRIRFDLGFYASPFRTHSVLFEGHWSEVRSGALDVADLARLGGATNLRGYREGEFLGSRLLWGTAEYRFFLAPRTFVGAFLDAGAVTRPALPSIGISSSDLMRFGYGVALRVDAAVGLLSVSLALGKGDGFGDAKLHVRVQNEF